MSEIEISVVIPVYNSQNCLDELAKRLTHILDDLNKRYEIILVNDCSPDNSWKKIDELCGIYSSLKGVNLRRNFGQDSAIMAGLNYSSGKWVIIMDDDLQHDPADIPTLLDGLERGYDVCYALFGTKKQSLLKNFGSWLNGKVATLVIKKPKGIYLSPYKALKREVVEQIIKYDGPYPYVDGLLFRVTRNITQVPVEHHERYAGRGNYNQRKSIRVWLRLATNFSVIPLRLATILGFVSSGSSLLMALYVIIRHILYRDSPVGWASLIVTILFIGGIQLISIGVIGEYIGRLFLHYSKEPQFVVKESVGQRAKSGE
jgi:glycosyltransferase involved in cell wall biosynthesis